jgi:hypothetical protein
LQRFPHVPQFALLVLGLTHWPAQQIVPAAHAHVPPQPSPPHTVPPQTGVQVSTTHVPLLQLCPLPQEPHDPPHPSAPQLLPPLVGVLVVTH